MSEARALTNPIGNGVATAVVSKMEGALDEERMHAELNRAAAARVTATGAAKEGRAGARNFRHRMTDLTALRVIFACCRGHCRLRNASCTFGAEQTQEFDKDGLNARVASRNPAGDRNGA